MKPFYAELVGYAEDEYKRRLADAIHPRQVRNESQFGKETGAHPVSLEQVNKNVDLIGAPLRLQKT